MTRGPRRATAAVAPVPAAVAPVPIAFAPVLIAVARVPVTGRAAGPAVRP
jgi:hypothetical protein